MTRLVYFLFFCSGLSGLIYQVIWVRVFGNVFGNTIYSASLVIAVFMLGLGVGSYVVGVWADRRYAAHPESLLRAYGYVELVIGLMGLGISALLPHLGQVSALVSSYSRDANGWYVLSTSSYVARGAIAIVLLTPITLLMGGTLTLLIRHLVRRDFDIGGWRIAVLYGVNTAGAALGCFLTDFALVPTSGLRSTQMVAVFFNVVAAAGALWLAGSPARYPRWGALASRTTPTPVPRQARGKAATAGGRVVAVGLGESVAMSPRASPALALTSLALGLSGFGAMGMEILWFRHFTILLGGFRAVFSLLLTVILVGIVAGSLVGGFVHRRTAQPAAWLMVVQALFVAATLLGLATSDARTVEAALMADPGYQAAAVVGRAVEATAVWPRRLAELWFNARPILLEVAVPALLMGFAFPLANAIVQSTERFVGRRAGVLYLSNTVGAVCGSLVAGFLLLPTVGIQASATILTIAAGLAVVPLYFATVGGVPPPLTQALRLAASRVARAAGAATRASAAAQPARGEAARGVGVPATEATLWGQGPHAPRMPRAATAALAGSMLIGGAALGLWLLLPSDYIITRALAASMENETLLTLSEGVVEVIAVMEVPGNGRRLLTNGHSMSSTARGAQRYMRALAHIPLLCIDDPETVLVIGFGVGNTTHAATLHPSIRRVEVADLSRDILAHASYFKDATRDVLNDARVVVYVNDGRHHLQMQPAASYDLIALEPPPPGRAGVAALYSSEFYSLARARLKPKGYISQWLPAYQVPAATTLEMIRAFLEVFPQAVLLSGAEADLLLVGVNDSRIEIDPARLAAGLSSAPAVEADLERLDLGSLPEIVGTFVGSAQTLAEATRDSASVSDDRPIQEYGVGSLLNLNAGVPASVVDLSQVAAWCPRCFVDGKPVPLVEGLDTYLALLNRAYLASRAEMTRTHRLPDFGTRVVAGSAYLGAIVPESADLRQFLGIDLAAQGKFDEAIAEFREALRLEPDSAETHWNLGLALASHGAPEEAIPHLRRVVQLDPTNGQAHYDLASTLLEARQLEDAVDQFRAALRLMPNSVEAHNNLGVALASQGKLDEAIDQFQRALTFDPEFADARRNLTIVLRQRQQLAGDGTH